MKRGKKSTKYFFNLEKKKGKEKLWNRVKTNDGKYKEDIVSILEEQVNFSKNSLPQKDGTVIRPHIY
jgi:hypothetical protein